MVRKLHELTGKLCWLHILNDTISFDLFSNLRVFLINNETDGFSNNCTAEEQQKKEDRAQKHIRKRPHHCPLIFETLSRTIY